MILPGNHDRYTGLPYGPLQRNNDHLETVLNTSPKYPGSSYPWSVGYRSPAYGSDPGAPSLLFFVFDSTASVIAREHHFRHRTWIYGAARGVSSGPSANGLLTKPIVSLVLVRLPQLTAERCPLTTTRQCTLQQYIITLYAPARNPVGQLIGRSWSRASCLSRRAWTPRLTLFSLDISTKPTVVIEQKTGTALDSFVVRVQPNTQRRTQDFTYSHSTLTVSRRPCSAGRMPSLG